MQLGVTLGVKLKDARIANKYTQTEVSDILQMSPSTISRLESHNSKNWTLCKLIQITALYRRSFFDVLCGGMSNLMPIVGDGSIVLVDDESVQIEIYQQLLKRILPNVNIVSFCDPLRADMYLYHNNARLVLTDYRMPGLNGGDIIERLKRDGGQNRTTPTILMTDKSEKEMIMRVAKNGNAIFFDKGNSKEVLVYAVTDLLKII